MVEPMSLTEVLAEIWMSRTPCGAAGRAMLLVFPGLAVSLVLFFLGTRRYLDETGLPSPEIRKRLRFCFGALLSAYAAAQLSIVIMACEAGPGCASVMLEVREGRTALFVYRAGRLIFCAISVACIVVEVMRKHETRAA